MAPGGWRWGDGEVESAVVNSDLGLDPSFAPHRDPGQVS